MAGTTARSGERAMYVTNILSKVMFLAGGIFSRFLERNQKSKGNFELFAVMCLKCLTAVFEDLLMTSLLRDSMLGTGCM